MELSLTGHPADGLSLKLNYGYTDARFRQYNNGRQDFRGNRVPYAPAHTLFAQAVWDLPLEVAGSKPSLDVNVRGVGDIQWNEANTVSQPFYMLAGASLTFSRPRWSLKLWGENITDTRYDTFYFMSMGNEFTQRGMPVTFGATLRVFLNNN